MNLENEYSSNLANLQQSINDKALNQYNTIYSNYLNSKQQEYENQQAELARQEAIRQYNENLALQKAQLEYQKQQDAIANAQKWASINKSYSSDNSFPLNFTDNSSNESNIITDYYNGPMTNSQKQSIDKYGAFNTADKNGVKYQPKGVIYDGQDYGKLNVAKRGNKTMTVGEWTDNKNFKNSSG